MMFRFIFLAVTMAAAAPARSENWGQWRGPSFDGSSPEKDLPVQFNPEKGVRWSAALPGLSGATPVVWSDHVFVMSPDEKGDQWLLCFARGDGKPLWKRLVAGGMTSNGRGNSTSPSPVTDGKTVWALVGTGQLAAFDFAGQPLWQRDLGKDYGKFNIMWTYGSSPLLFDGRLYVQVLQRSPADGKYPGVTDTNDRESYLLALEPATGKTLWKQVRATDAVMESRESYTTPIPHVVGDRKQILVAGGDVLTGHDAATGKELWRGGGVNKQKGRSGGEWMRIVASPVSAGPLALVCGPKQSATLAFRTDGAGDITESGKAWVFDERKTPDCCTPAYHDGKIYILDGDAQVMTCLQAADGKKIWQVNLDLDRSRGKEVFRASPTWADGKLYSLGERGTVVVQDADGGKVLNVGGFGGAEGARGSIAISEGQLFIRTTDKLWCVGK